MSFYIRGCGFRIRNPDLLVAKTSQGRIILHFRTKTSTVFQLNYQGVSFKKEVDWMEYCRCRYKITLFEKSKSKKFKFGKFPAFWRVSHSIFFWQFFSWNQSCQQLKSANPQHFHEFFTQNVFDNFSREIKVINS